MEVLFYPKEHIYKSVDVFEDIQWVSASRLAGKYKKPFPADMSLKCSQKKDGKWFGIPPNKIEEIWKTENVRSTTLGTWYHEKEEEKLIGKDSDVYDGVMLPIIRPIWQDGVKISLDQKLKPGIYPELLVYLKSARVCGQFDRVNIVGEFIDIEDHKSNKDLKKPPYKNWEGKVERMLPPLLHLENSKVAEYSLQMSIAMYIISRHNPLLRPRNLTINHVTFEVEGENEWGYPIHRLDEKNEPIIKDVEKLKVPYLKREVELMFEQLKTEVCV